MFTTMIDEAVNGWIVTIWRPGRAKEQFIYERLEDAVEFQNTIAKNYERGDYR